MYFRRESQICMAAHNETGIKGEDLAAIYLEKKGYAILEKNWRSGKAEIDIIAQYKDELVIAEVKTRTGSYFEEPEESVTRKKQRHLIKAANAYIEEKNFDNEVRFDVIAVILTGETHHINHIEGAFVPVA